MFDGLVCVAAHNVAVRLQIAAVAHDDLGRTGGGCLLGPVDRGELFVDDTHELFRLFKRFLIARADERDCVAKVLRDLPLADERRLVLLDVADVLLARDVLCRQHADDAGERFRFFRADIEHAGARVLAAHRAAIAHAVNKDVVGVLAVALHLFGDIDAVHARADLKVFLLFGNFPLA